MPAAEILANSARGGRSLWTRCTSVLPGLGLGVLAKFSCSMCIAVYAGVLSSLGLGFATTNRGLMGLTVFFLLLATVSITWSTRRHGRWGPLLLAIAGATVVVTGRALVSSPPLYGGAAVVAVASLWNLWLRRPRPVELVPLTARDHGI